MAIQKIFTDGYASTLTNKVSRGEDLSLYLNKEFVFDESETGYYLIAEIVNILCDEKYLAEDGKPDVEKMELITFDPVHHTYIQLGKTVGNAFSDGKQIK
jgi:hypothetical protein